MDWFFIFYFFYFRFGFLVRMLPPAIGKAILDRRRLFA